MDWPGQQILVVVASIHMQHSEGRSGGGFLNNSSCLGVSRNLSARGNLGRLENRLFGRGNSAGQERLTARQRSRLIFLHWIVEQWATLMQYPKLVT